MDLEKKREQGARLLRRLYEATEGHTRKTENYWKLGEELGLTREATDAVADHLVNVAGWADYASFESMFITAEGVREVEGGQKQAAESTAREIPESRLKSADVDMALKAFAGKFNLPPDTIPLYARLWQLETWLREMVYVELNRLVAPTGRTGTCQQG